MSLIPGDVGTVPAAMIQDTIGDCGEIINFASAAETTEPINFLKHPLVYPLPTLLATATHSPGDTVSALLVNSIPSELNASLSISCSGNSLLREAKIILLERVFLLEENRDRTISLNNGGLSIEPKFSSGCRTTILELTLGAG